MNPPSLMLQTNEGGPTCATCAHYCDLEYCTKYGVSVRPDALCRSYESIFSKGKRQYAEP